MRAAATWENEEYRCQLCMQLYAADVGHAHTPLVVCQNVHTVCAQCYGTSTRARAARLKHAHARAARLKHAHARAARLKHAHAHAARLKHAHARAGELQARQPPKCPQCRADLWADAKANRDFISVLSRLELQCGGCESDVRMSNADALRHASECPNNHLRCPMPSGFYFCARALHA